MGHGKGWRACTGEHQSLVLTKGHASSQPHQLVKKVILSVDMMGVGEVCKGNTAFVNIS